MDDRLRQAWTSIIRAADYDAHMEAVGQAQANADLVVQLFRERPPASDARILFAGAGTGQMFEFAGADFLFPFRTTFTDINAQYLNVLCERLRPCSGLRFRLTVDDIEQTKLSPGFALVVAVLVLEHVNWQKAIATMCALATKRVYVVLQENPPDVQTAMTQTRPPIGSMEVFTRIDSHLLPPADVESEFVKHGFRLTWKYDRAAQDGKKMLGREFSHI